MIWKGYTCHSSVTVNYMTETGYKPILYAIQYSWSAYDKLERANLYLEWKFKWKYSAKM